MHNVDEIPNPWHDRKAVDCKIPNNVLISSFFVGFRHFINRVNCNIKNNLINNIKEVTKKFIFINAQNVLKINTL